MINKKLDEVKKDLDTIIKLMQDDNYLDTLDKGLDKSNEIIKKQDRKIERLENIIKEVREYCKNDDNFELADLYSQSIADRIQEELLEILDKEK